MSYKLSPQPGSDASHLITAKSAIANVPIREAQELTKQRAKRSFRFDPMKYGAKKLGGGAYGTAYIMQITPSSLAGLQEGLSFGGGKIITSMPAMGSKVVVKIARQNNQSDQDFYKDNIRENIVHKRFSVDPCQQVPRASKPICVSKYVPTFYMSFIAGSPRKLESVTVMALAGNMSLDKFVRGKKIPVDFFVDVERAICSMWLSGYLHGDLHRENIMVDTATKKIQIIDFGFALKMPPGFVAVLSRRISNMIASDHQGSLGDVWLTKPVEGKLRLINYSNRVMKGRGYPWYNPDYKVLQSLYNQIPRNLRKTIPKERSIIWGIAEVQPVLPKQIRQKTSTPRTARRSSSPILRASAAKTYRTSRPISSRTILQKESPPSRPKTPTPPPLRPKTPSPPQQKPPMPMFSKKSPTQPRPKTSTPPRQKSRTFQRLDRPSFERSPSRVPTPLRSLTNAERAAVYKTKQPRNAALETLKRRREECQRRGLQYNPITKQCSSRSTAVYAGCREDCARIGKRCGPRGKCIKL